MAQHHKREYRGYPLWDSSFELDELLKARIGRHVYTQGSIPHWLGTSTPEKYEEYVAAGKWPHMTEKLREMLGELPAVDRVQTQNIRMRRKRTRGDFGNELDIHAVRQGRVDRAWDKMEHSPKWSEQNKLVHLVVNMTISSGCDVSELLWRAAAAYRVQEALASSGYSVAITVVRFGLASKYIMQSVLVKPYGQQVTDDRLAILIHGAFYRYYIIGLARCLTPFASKTDDGVSPMDADVLPLHIEEERQRGAHVIRIGHCDSRALAQATINRVIGELNNAPVGAEE